MSKKYILILSVLLPVSLKASVSVSMGLLRNMNTVQDRDGKETRDPFMPMLKVGWTSDWSLYGLRLSPHAFYALSSRESDDSFGGDYSVNIYGFLYDLIYPVNANLGLRFGLGNVIKSIEGEGGTVTIPNGDGTATAYKPGEKVTSYTGTLNFGADYTFGSPLLFVKNLGLRFEYLMMSPLKNDKRTGYLMLSLQGYF